MAKIVVDGNEYEVNPNNNLLQECLSLGLDLPYFCWHPCMGSVGACRQCAVKQYRDENDEKGTIVMACMTPARAPECAKSEEHVACFCLEGFANHSIPMSFFASATSFF